MRLPRDLTGDELIKALLKLGYEATRQTGSHIRVTTQRQGEHHVTVPRHNPLRLGTLAGIPGDVALHLHMSREEVVESLFV